MQYSAPSDEARPENGHESAFHIIVLGSGGGPLEDNVTGFLVRSMNTQWGKGSILAVDAGTHLAAVSRIFDQHINSEVSEATISLGRSSPQIGRSLTTGPFAGFPLQHKTAKANAAYLVRNLITTYLITHPHLDHLSGFVINTASFQHTSCPKRLAGLPSTIDAFKTHIFNDVIWPNLSDENNGVGLVSYMRLAEGGNLAIGEGKGRGYIEVCDGLAVKSWSVSHGKCMNDHTKQRSGSGQNIEQFNDMISRRTSQSSALLSGSQLGIDHTHATGFGSIDSSAFFLRDDHTGFEILIFGDVEPDSLSLSPRNAQVWADAAPKVAAGTLKGIFIECSYDESQSDDTLFGHLAPRHVVAELQVLADKLRSCQSESEGSASLKRKRHVNATSGGHEPGNLSKSTRISSAARRKASSGTWNSSPTLLGASDAVRLPKGSLRGLRIIIIHVKDTLKDDVVADELVIEELRRIAIAASLDCTFEMSKTGCSIWL